MTAQTAFPARHSRPFRAARPAASLAVPAQSVAPPSQEIVAAVAAFGDVVEEREDGLVSRRFSPAALERGPAALILADAADRRRALDVQVVWNEAEGEIDRVIDFAPLRRGGEAADQVNRYAAARMRSAGAASDRRDRAYAA